MLIVEQDTSLVRELEEAGKGLQIVTRDHIGVVNAVAWSEREKAYVGVSDPRARESSAWLRLREKGSGLPEKARLTDRR
jgi:gamma-glutamyltranspeptidase